MAQNPNPLLPITSYTGVTRTLDDWATVFNIALIVLPDRPGGRRRSSRSSTASSRRSATATCARSCACRRRKAITKRILGDAVDRWLTWCDPDRALVDSLGLERLPAFLMLRQDTQLVTAAQGWSPTEWQRVAHEIARKEHWTTPIVAGRGDPAPTPGWPVAS